MHQLQCRSHCPCQISLVLLTHTRSLGVYYVPQQSSCASCTCTTTPSIHHHSLVKERGGTGEAVKRRIDGSPPSLSRPAITPSSLAISLPPRRLSVLLLRIHHQGAGGFLGGLVAIRAVFPFLSFFRENRTEQWPAAGPSVRQPKDGGKWRGSWWQLFLPPPSSKHGWGKNPIPITNSSSSSSSYNPLGCRS